MEWQHVGKIIKTMRSSFDKPLKANKQDFGSKTAFKWVYNGLARYQPVKDPLQTR